MKKFGKVMLAICYAILALFPVWIIASWLNVVLTNLPADPATIAWWNFFGLLV